VYSRTGRTEERRPLSVEVRIASLEHPAQVESAITRNVSNMGLRAGVKNQWLPDEPVVVESPPGHIRSRGWVVYCQSTNGGEFAIGLRLLVPQSDWARKVEKSR